MSTDPNAGTPASTQATPSTEPASTPASPAAAAPASEPTPSQNSALEFIPEAYRNDPSFTKYKTQDEFFKGVQNLTKLVGQKQIVQGLQLPGENASEEEVSNFYKALGRPEASDKYTYAEDLKGYEGLDLDSEKKGFSEIAFQNGLTQKQADAVFKAYLERSNAQFGSRQEGVQKTFDETVKTAFGDNAKAGLDLAKKGAKVLGDADKINLEDVTNPLLLKALAKLGEDHGEDELITGGKESKESILEEAKRLQATPEYLRGDKAVVDKVAQAYKRVYG